MLLLLTQSQYFLCATSASTTNLITTLMLSVQKQSCHTNGSAAPSLSFEGALQHFLSVLLNLIKESRLARDWFFKFFFLRSKQKQRSFRYSNFYYWVRQFSKIVHFHIMHLEINASSQRMIPLLLRSFDTFLACVSLQAGKGLLWNTSGAASTRVRLPAGSGQWRRASVSVLPSGLPNHWWGLGHSILQPQVDWR